MPALKHHPGDRHGRLVIVEREPGGRLKCRCDCGATHYVSINQWSNGVHGRRGGVKSCGCLLRERNARSVAAAARAAGLSPHTVRARVLRGETLDEALDERGRAGELLPAADGTVATKAQHARRLGISKQAIHHRIKAGWDPQDAISLPRGG